MSPGHDHAASRTGANRTCPDMPAQPAGAMPTTPRFHGHAPLDGALPPV